MKNKYTIIHFVALVAMLTAGYLAGSYAWSHIGTPPTVAEDITVKKDVDMTDGKTIALSFPKGGRIEQVLAKNGDSVRQGQTLAKLASSDLDGTIAQTKGALELAEAQYASLNAQYATAKKQQDTLVANAYHTLLSSGLTADPDAQEKNSFSVTGTYACDKEGTYTLQIFGSADTDSGYSVRYSGLESGVIGLKYMNAVSLGSCGLQIRFNRVQNEGVNTFTTWTLNVPNKKSGTYLANKNAYDLAVTTREKVLSDLANTIGTDSGNSVAKAQVDAARGAYEAAVGAMQNNLVVAPTDGVISFVDKDLKVGQAAVANKTVINISPK